MHLTTYPLAKLESDPKSPRQHDARNIETIRRSLATFGQLRPLVVQKSTGMLIIGHATLDAMRLLDWPSAAVLELDVDEGNATLLHVLDNRAGELARWDEEYLGAALNIANYGGADLSLSGFTPDELDALMNTVTPYDEDDK